MCLRAQCVLKLNFITITKQQQQATRLSRCCHTIAGNEDGERVWQWEVMINIVIFPIVNSANVSLTVVDRMHGGGFESSQNFLTYSLLRMDVNIFKMKNEQNFKLNEKISFFVLKLVWKFLEHIISTLFHSKNMCETLWKGWTKFFPK